MKDPRDMDLEEYGTYLKRQREKDLTEEWYVSAFHPNIADEKWDDNEGDDLHSNCDHDSLRHGANCQFCGWCGNIDGDEPKCRHRHLTKYIPTQTLECDACEQRFSGADIDHQLFFNARDPEPNMIHHPLLSKHEELPSGPHPFDTHKFSRLDLYQMIKHLDQANMDFYHLPCKQAVQIAPQIKRLKIMAECKHVNWIEFGFGHYRKCQDCGNEWGEDL